MPVRPPYLLVAFLPHEEQEELRRTAAGNPGAQRQIETSERLKDAIDRGLRIRTGDIDDAVLAFLALDAGPADGWREALLGQISGNESLSRRLAEFRARARDIEQQGDAEMHFRRLSGHTGPGTPLRLVWLSAAAAVLLLMLGHGLAMRVLEDPVRRAVWEAYADPVRVTRGGETRAQGLREARALAAGARSTTLGLWPRYRSADLARAESLLTGEPGPGALLELARIHVLAGDRASAAQALHAIPDTDPSATERDQLVALLGAGQ